MIKWYGAVYIGRFLHHKKAKLLWHEFGIACHHLNSVKCFRYRHIGMCSTYFVWNFITLFCNDHHFNASIFRNVVTHQNEIFMHLFTTIFTSTFIVLLDLLTYINLCIQFSIHKMLLFRCLHMGTLFLRNISCAHCLQSSFALFSFSLLVLVLLLVSVVVVVVVICSVFLDVILKFVQKGKRTRNKWVAYLRPSVHILNVYMLCNRVMNL